MITVNRIGLYLRSRPSEHHCREISIQPLPRPSPSSRGDLKSLPSLFHRALIGSPASFFMQVLLPGQFHYALSSFCPTSQTPPQLEDTSSSYWLSVDLFQWVSTSATYQKHVNNFVRSWCPGLLSKSDLIALEWIQGFSSFKNLSGDFNMRIENTSLFLCSC